MFPTVAHSWVAWVTCLAQAVLREMSSCLDTNLISYSVCKSNRIFQAWGLTIQGKTERGLLWASSSRHKRPLDYPKISGDYWLFPRAFLRSPGDLPHPEMFSLDSGNGMRISSPVFSHYILSSNTLWRCWHEGEFALMARLVSGGPLPQPP